MRSLPAEARGYPATVHLCEPGEFAQALRAHGVRAWYQALGFQPRGFASGAEVWVRADALGLAGLVAHELGHVAGLGHVPAPTTMNPLGFLRWWDREGLLAPAQRVLDGSA